MSSIVRIALALAGASAFLASSAASQPAAKADAVCVECVRATMQTLAGEALRGRACGGPDEAAAADYIESELRRLGVSGALAGGAYQQPVELRTPTYASAPTLTVGGRVHTHGQAVVFTGGPEALSAPLARVTGSPAAAGPMNGKIVLYDVAAPDRSAVGTFLKAGAAGVILPASETVLQRWSDLAARPPGATEIVGVPSDKPGRGPLVIYARPEAVAQLRTADGANLQVRAPVGAVRARTTHNVIGVIHGSAPDADRQAILLSAHYDHLGLRGGKVYYGANDDASGTAAVLEFARMFAAGAKPRRTVYFALFGCEEEGGLGAQLFLARPPTAIDTLAANLEFEMIGVDDPKSPERLMLTGWERSNLGPTLAAHGARIGPDPYPEQNFFQRSDNYQLALKGVVAQTVSAWPIPPTYHQASDDLAHVDIDFMGQVIGSLAEPVRWLANSDFRPEWAPGQKP